MSLSFCLLAVVTDGRLSDGEDLIGSVGLDVEVTEDGRQCRTLHIV